MMWDLEVTDLNLKKKQILRTIEMKNELLVQSDIYWPGAIGPVVKSQAK